LDGFNLALLLLILVWPGIAGNNHNKPSRYLYDGDDK